LHVKIPSLLPWRTLTLIATLSVASCLPALAVSYGLQMTPFLRALVAATVYTSAFMGMAIGFGLFSKQELAALSQLLGRFQFLLPFRYQHKAS
jgi:hypothetical protein